MEWYESKDATKVRSLELDEVHEFFLGRRGGYDLFDDLIASPGFN